MDEFFGPAVRGLLLAKVRGESPVDEGLCVGFLDEVDEHLTTCRQATVDREYAGWGQCPSHNDTLGALWGDVECPHGFWDYVSIGSYGSFTEELLEFGRRSGLPVHKIAPPDVTGAK